MTWSRWVRRHLLSQPGRTLIAWVAVVIGVAVYVAVSLGTRAVITEIERLGSAAGAFDEDAVDFFRQIEAGIAPLAACALIVSGFIIYLTTSRTVGDRWSTFGTLRAIGASRHSVVRAVLAEAIVIGAAGTVGGLVVGRLLGPLLAAGFASTFSVPAARDGGSLSAAQLITVFVGGIGVPALAAAIPARRAAGIEPAMAMRHQRDDSSLPVRRGTLGVFLFVAGVAWSFLADGDLRLVGVVSAMVGVLAGVPLLVAPVAASVRRVIGRAGPGIGDIAAAQLARRQGRMATTVGLVAGTLTLVAMTATIAASQRPAFVDAVETTFGYDAELWIPDGPDGDNILDTLGRLATYTEVRRNRVGVVEPAVTTENLTVIDPETYFDVAGFVWTRGTDGEDAVAALRRGGAVLVSTNVADGVGVGVGDQITLAGQTPRQLTVAGIYYGFAYGTSDAVVVPEADAGGLGDETATMALVDFNGSWNMTVGGGYTAAGGGSTAGGGGWSPAALRADIVGQFDGIWGLIHLLAAVVAVLGLAGMANTLAMEVLDRREEYGVLRALGLQRREVLRLVVTEGALFAAVAAVAGVVAGTVLGWALANAGEGGVEELTVPLRLPVSAVVVLFAGAVVLGGLASTIPGRQAAKVSPTELLRAAD